VSKYNVIMVVPVNVKFVDIEADSQAAAIDGVAENGAEYGFDSRMFDHTFQDHLAPTHPGIAYTEFADEVSEFLVDEVGDDEYERSRWYGPDGKTPLTDVSTAESSEEKRWLRAELDRLRQRMVDFDLLHDFAARIARLTKDGELVDGDEFVMENDDAVITLIDLIGEARELASKTEYINKETD